MRIAKIAVLTGAFALGLTASASYAGVSAKEAAQLGKNLTPVGAQKAGSKDGKIPEWTGGLPLDPKGVSGLPHISSPDRNKDLNGWLVKFYKEYGGKSLPNPYAGEKPEFTITAQNWKQYKDKLPNGLQAMFQHYPDFKMHVYKTHRGVAFPQKVYDWTRKNAENAVLKGQNGVHGAAVGFPYPIPSGPHKANEVIWNHALAWHVPNTAVENQAHAIVSQDGSYYLVGNTRWIKFFYSRFGMTPKELENKYNDMYVYFLQQVTSPARLAGEVLLVWEPVNQEKHPRSAWIYNPGQRRVRRAPNVEFDNTTGTHSDGLSTDDNFNMWNGSQEQYNWKLLGKKEMYVPYDDFKLGKSGRPYSDIIKAHHLNQDLVRYELHRVWVVQATLKKGIRNIYSKRVFYVDEDSWNILEGDLYDDRGNLWRVEQGYLIPVYIVPTAAYSMETINDLSSGRYEAMGLTQNKPQTQTIAAATPDSKYTPANLRRVGIR